MNHLKTLVLLSTLTALLLWAGEALGGQGGLLFALMLAGLMNLWAHWFSDRIVLRMHHAVAIDAAASPDLYGLVRQMAMKAGLPVPRLYLIPEATPNAFRDWPQPRTWDRRPDRRPSAAAQQGRTGRSHRP